MQPLHKIFQFLKSWQVVLKKLCRRQADLLRGRCHLGAGRCCLCGGPQAVRGTEARHPLTPPEPPALGRTPSAPTCGWPTSDLREGSAWGRACEGHQVLPASAGAERTRRLQRKAVKHLPSLEWGVSLGFLAVTSIGPRTFLVAKALMAHVGPAAEWGLNYSWRPAWRSAASRARGPSGRGQPCGGSPEGRLVF